VWRKKKKTKNTKKPQKPPRTNQTTWKLGKNQRVKGRREKALCLLALQAGITYNIPRCPTKPGQLHPFSHVYTGKVEHQAEVRERSPPPLIHPTHHQPWLARTRSRLSEFSLKTQTGDTMLSPS